MKKNLKHVLVVAALLVMSAVLLVGCGGSEKSTTGGTSEKKVLTMGTNASFPPYEFYEGDKIVGIDPEIAEAIAKELGYELEIKDMEFDAITSAVSTGKIDMGMAGMSVTEDRLKSVNFSDSYAIGIQSVIVPKDSTIQTPEDLAGKKVGVQLSTTGDLYATEEFGEENIARFANGSDATVALTQGKIDAIIIDNQPAKVYVEQNEGLKLLETDFAEEEYAIATAKDNDELTNKINETLKKLIADGTVQKIIDKYITAE